MRAEDLQRPIMMHICKDGTITYRKRGEPVFNGRALPFFSVDTEEEAQDLQVMLCSLQYDTHPDLPPTEPWYRYWQFSGELDGIPEVTAKFRELYTRFKEQNSDQR